MILSTKNYSYIKFIIVILSKCSTVNYTIRNWRWSTQLYNLFFRYLYVASRSGKFPTLISCMNQKQDSPRAALLVHVLFAYAFSYIGNLEKLVILVMGGIVCWWGEFVNGRGRLRKIIFLTGSIIEMTINY